MAGNKENIFNTNFYYLPKIQDLRFILIDKKTVQKYRNFWVLQLFNSLILHRNRNGNFYEVCFDFPKQKVFIKFRDLKSIKCYTYMLV